MAAPHFDKQLTPNMNQTLEGTATIFQAKFTGNPRPDIKIYHDKDELQKSKKVDIKILDDGNITIVFHKVARDDDGTYKITAKNDKGEVHTTAELLVEFDPTED